MELGHWVTAGSMGHLGRLSPPGHRVTGSSFPPGVRPEFSGFRKEAQDKDIKIYIFVKIRPTVIEIYIHLYSSRNDSIEKIKKNVTKLQKNKLRNLNKYTT